MTVLINFPFRHLIVIFFCGVGLLEATTDGLVDWEGVGVGVGLISVNPNFARLVSMLL